MIPEKIRELVLRELELDEAARVVPEARFVDDLGADSLRIFALVTALEDAFDVSIDDNEIQDIQTVADAVRTVEGLVAGRV